MEETQARGGSLSGRRSEDCQWRGREEDAEEEKSILKENERIKGVSKVELESRIFESLFQRRMLKAP